MLILTALQPIASMCPSSLSTRCLADAGPMDCPDKWPYPDRFLGTITNRLSSRLPRVTGSNPHTI